MGRVKKYVRKQVNRLKGYAKKRYAPDGRIKVDRIAKDVMYVKSLLNTERKYLDTAISGNFPADSTNWNIVRLNTIPRGEGENQRSGASVRMKSIQLRGKVETSGTLPSANPTVRVRVVMFMDREVNAYNTATLPSCNELYKDNTVSSMRNYDSLKSKRFAILKVWYIKLTAEKPEAMINYYKKMHLPVKWAGTNTDGTGIIQNPVYLAFSSDTNTTGGQQTVPFYDFQERITYVDN